MKNAMKKLMAFALAAIMLISAVPFQANAAAGDLVKFILVSQADAAYLDTHGGWEIGTHYVQYTLNSDSKLEIADYEDLRDNYSKPLGIKGWVAADGTEIGSVKGAVLPSGRIYPINKTAATLEKFCDYCGVGEGVAHKNENNCPEFQCLGCNAKINAGEAHGSTCSQYTCPECGVKVNKGEAHQAPCSQYTCGNCGASGSASHASNCVEFVCPDCGAKVNAGEAHTSGCEDYVCPDCGSKINQGATHTTKCPSYVPEETPEPPAQDPVDPPADEPTVQDPVDPPADEPTVDEPTLDDPAEDEPTEEEPATPLTVYVYLDNVKKKSKTFLSEQVISDIIDEVKKDTWAFDHYTINGISTEYTKINRVVEPGQTVKLYFETKEYKANSCKVYLHIFMNNDIDAPAKTINITNGIAADGKLDLNTDVKSVILEYFSAKDSNGISLDGMYSYTGNWAGDYITDSGKRETISNVKQMRAEGNVHLTVMIKNAKLKSSSTADSTNPKTGDQIFAPVAIMAVSASVLAVVAFYLNKKRAM